MPKIRPQFKLAPGQQLHVRGVDGNTKIITVQKVRPARPVLPVDQSIAHREQYMSSASDCTFLVGPKKQEFKALKGVLGLVSPVFKAMFFGGLPETANILVPDVTPAAFQALLCHAYDLPLNWTSLKEALDILYVSHKYEVFKLEDMITYNIKMSINASTVFTILQDQVFQSIADLKSYCLNFFGHNTEDCFNSDKFLEIPITLAKQLFYYDSMKVSSELVVFKAFERYAAKNNLKRFKGSTKNSEHKILEELLGAIRFLSMTSAEFEEISHTELLNDKEKLVVLAHSVNHNSTYPIPATISKERSKRIAPNVLIAIEQREFYFPSKYSSYLVLSS